MSTLSLHDALPISPDAPDPGATNVTFTPETGLLPASFTVTASAFAKAVLIVADCGVVPAFAVMLDAIPPVPPAALNAAKAAAQLSDAPSNALAEAVPAASCIWSSAISFVFGFAGTASSTV